MIPPSRNTIDRWLEDAREGLDLIEKHFDELHAVALIPSAVDGFGSGGQGERRAPGHSDPVPAYATASDLVDLVAEWVEDDFAHLRSAVSDLKRVKRLTELIIHRGDLRYRDSGAGHCLACGRVVTGAVDDKIKGGHCAACTSAYNRWRASSTDPSPIQFRKRRWAELCEQRNEQPSWSAWKEWQDGNTGPPRLARKRETA